MMIGTLLYLVGLFGATDAYGGWDGVQGSATGFFHVEQIDGVWWIIDPEGNAFLSKGVNHVSYTADHAPSLGYSPYGRVTEKKYGSPEAWAEATATRLKSWGFNTIGAWSTDVTYRQGLAYTVILNLAARAGADWQKGHFPDVFSEAFREAIDRAAKASVEPRRDDPYLLGYFTDNELRWGPDWRSDRGLLADFFALPDEAPGRRAVLDFLVDHYGTIDAFNRTWGTDYASFDALASVPTFEAVGEAMRAAQFAAMWRFVRNSFPKEAIVYYGERFYGTIDAFNEHWGTTFRSFEEIAEEKPESPLVDEWMALEAAWVSRVAGEYFRITNEAIRRYDPNHMILGCRFAGYAPESVVRAMAPYVDIISFNNYDPTPPENRLREIHEWTGRPIMLTEFSFKADDSGLPNTRGAGRPVETQQDRADGYARYVTALMRLPYLVGFHWFEYTDEPAEGRFDGENSNYGLVNIEDEPWEVLTERMTQVNATLERLHAESAER